MTQIGQDVPNHLMFNEEIFENLPPSLSLIFYSFLPLSCPCSLRSMNRTNFYEQIGAGQGDKDRRFGGGETLVTAKQ